MFYTINSPKIKKVGAYVQHDALQSMQSMFICITFTLY